jgi:hypothetical protein
VWVRGCVGSISARAAASENARGISKWTTPNSNCQLPPTKKKNPEFLHPATHHRSPPQPNPLPPRSASQAAPARPRRPPQRPARAAGSPPGEGPRCGRAGRSWAGPAARSRARCSWCRSWARARQGRGSGRARSWCSRSRGRSRLRRRREGAGWWWCGWCRCRAR